MTDTDQWIRLAKVGRRVVAFNSWRDTVGWTRYACCQRPGSHLPECPMPEFEAALANIPAEAKRLLEGEAT